METSKCRGCGAEIIWAITEQGKRIPLDAKDERRFIVGVNQADDEVEAVLCKTYTTHFATCPKADQFRKERLH